MFRVATLAFALLLLAAPAAHRLRSPDVLYRVTGGSRGSSREHGRENIRLRTTQLVGRAAHARNAPRAGVPHCGRLGRAEEFQLRFPVRGTYVYDYDEEDSGTCKETFAFTRSSRGTAAARQIGTTRVRFLWGLDPRRRAGYVAHECRPPTNNALLYFLANQPSMTVTMASSALSRPTFTVTARGTQTREATLTWRVTLSVRRLGSR